MRRYIACLLLLCLSLGCRKQVEPPLPKPPDQPAATSKAPDEPIQRLAWQAAQQISYALTTRPVSIHIQEIRNEVGWPIEAERYFRDGLEKNLSAQNISLRAPFDLDLRGKLFHQNAQIVFAYTLTKEGSIALSDSIAIEDNERLRNTLAQFERIPSKPAEGLPNPLAVLTQEPLDVAAIIKEGQPVLVFLYSDRIEILDWRKSKSTMINIPSQFRSLVRSRAPSGKLIKLDPGWMVINNNLNAPVFIDDHWKPGPLSTRPAWIPIADPGLNSFTLKDGRFYDFDVDGKTISAIDMQNMLSVATAGHLLSSTTAVGGTLAVQSPSIYTSSPSIAGVNDAILKFALKDRSIDLETSRPVDGQILDLLIADLNQDGRPELIVTSRKSQGVITEVQDLF